MKAKIYFPGAMYSNRKTTIKKLIHKTDLKWNYIKSGWFSADNSRRIEAEFKGHNLPATFYITGDEEFITAWEQVAAILNASFTRLEDLSDYEKTKPYNWYDPENIRNRLIAFKADMKEYLKARGKESQLDIHVEAMKQAEINAANRYNQYMSEITE